MRSRSLNAEPDGPPDHLNGEILRLNRLLARAGHGSRRSVEALVTGGRVRVDGEVVRDLGRRVDPVRQRVEVDGEVLRLPAEFRVYAFHKPRGVVATLAPQRGQRGLAEFRAAADLPARVMPVGRLDADSAGLLLWTDDGELSQALLKPANEVWKRYRVVCQRPLVERACRLFLQGGLELDGRPLRPCRLTLDGPADRRHWLLELHEGRNRQIRRMFAAVGNRVVELTRIAVGPVMLGRLRAGGFRRLNRREEAALRRAARREGPQPDPKRRR